MQNVFCPVCNNQFNLNKNLKYRIDSVSFFFRQIEAERFEPFFKRKKASAEGIKSFTTVICPHCGKDFKVDGYKFFGLLSASKMKILIIFFLSIFIAVPIYVLMKDLM